MKFLFSIILLFTITFLITSCQKELSFEAGLAKGLLAKDSNGDCSPIMVSGTYQKDTLLKAATNYVDVQVNISQVGSYLIKTDTVNGYSFSAAGTIAVVGLNTVRLLAAGKPIAASFDMFTVKYDTSVCQFNVVVGAGGGGGNTAAVYTLVGSPTACTAATQSGNYNMGLPTSNNNTVTINANVTTAGNYSINTTVVNGVSFSGAGNLAMGNNQSITLVANGGTPTAMGTFSYPISNGTSNCSFDVIYGATVAPATFTFNCPSATSAGTYQQGTPTTTANTISLPITVTTGGSYNITTTNNGVTFSGSGVLPATPATQSITLTATVNNIPTASGIFSYIVSAGGGPDCAVSITYTAASTTNGTISFKIGSVTKTFNFSNSADTSFQTFPPPAPAGNFYILSLMGDAAASPSTESFTLTLAKPAPYFTNNTTYTVNQFMQSIALHADYTDNTGAGVSYTATTDGTTQTPAFSVTITTITPTRVTGTFSGPLKNSGGTVITATAGAFDLPLQ